MARAVTTLRLAIAESGRTQRDIAAALGLHEVALSQYVNGRRIPPDDRKVAIATELGRTADELWRPLDEQVQAAA